MAKLTAAQTRRAIERALHDWRPILGLDRWQVFAHWQSAEEVAASDVGNDASTVAQPEYMSARIYINPTSLETSNNARSARHLEFLMLHELVHCLTWSLTQAAEAVMVNEWHRRELERQTCELARALWVARYGEEPPE